MIRYVHGSEDSLDLDVYYVFDKLPSFKECQDFCSNKEENRNIIVIKDGIVTDCFKGTVDEINNGLLQTYHLHPQEFDNIVERKLERDVLLKIIRVVRCLLSHCSRTQYRTDVKKTLKSNSWKERLDTLSNIKFSNINDFGKSGTKKNIYKVIAFQIGQGLGLLEGEEYYTKSSIALKYKDLKPFLYREDDVNLTIIDKYINLFLNSISKIEYNDLNDYVLFKTYNKKFNLRKEEYLK